MKTLVSQEKEYPWMPYEEALAKLQSDGYVRIDGHTASTLERLDELFHVIKPAKEAGTYGAHLSLGEAVARAKKDQIAADAGLDIVAIQAENAALKAQLEVLSAEAGKGEPPAGQTEEPETPPEKEKPQANTPANPPTNRPR